MKPFALSLFPLALVLALPRPAAAQQPPARPASMPTTEAAAPPPPRVAVGCKLGNGVGFYGADVVVQAVPHLALDLTGTLVPHGETSADSSGWALALELALELHPQGATPYLGVGAEWIHLVEDGIGAADAPAYFANLGYEWKLACGIGIELGGGVAFVPVIHAQVPGAQESVVTNKVLPNLEAGLRYYF